MKAKHVNIEVFFLGPLGIARKECKENGVFRVSCSEGERIKRVCVFLVIPEPGRFVLWGGMGLGKAV